jgi:predicted nucleic acid-binding OB-fold protein
MAGSYHFNLWLDSELEAALRHYAAEKGIKLSQAARDLLRHALGLVSTPREAAWIEAFNEASAVTRKRINQALRQIADDIVAE